jgi:putative SOS response-associated peptidase YedK
VLEVAAVGERTDLSEDVSKHVFLHSLQTSAGFPDPVAGLIGLQAADIDIQDALRVAKWEYEGQWIPHPVVRLTTTLPIAINKDNARVAVRARWGFPVGGGRPVGNARDDKLMTSPMWGSMLAKSPCLVASTGIYEQATLDGKKTSLWFRRRDGKAIVMPGLSAARKMDEGEGRLCCAIVTTTPNQFFGQFHDRQVCVLSPKEADAWMATTDKQEAAALLHAPAEDEWEAIPVDDRIFKPGIREDSDLVPIGPPMRAGDAVPAPGAAKAAAPKQPKAWF